MKVSKAIEILKELNIDCWRVLPPDKQDAVNLSIESLKIIQAYRKWLKTNLCCGLPGETPEDDTT